MSLVSAHKDKLKSFVVVIGLLLMVVTKSYIKIYTYVGEKSLHLVKKFRHNHKCSILEKYVWN